MSVKTFPEAKRSLVTELSSSYCVYEAVIGVLLQVGKCVVVTLLLLGVVPLLLGLLFEFIAIIPLRVPLHQSPIYFPWQVGTLPCMYRAWRSQFLKPHARSMIQLHLEGRTVFLRLGGRRGWGVYLR